MGKLRSRVVRPMAGVLMLAFAIASSVECVVGSEMTPEEKVCCAGMHGDCGEAAISMSCCPPDTPSAPSLAAAKSTVVFVPVAALVAVLAPPTPAVGPSSQFFAAIAESSSSPPGVPAYLFFSSFRI